MTDETEHVKRTDEGASIQVEITRGTGTRDQEKWRIKGKGETAVQAIEEFRQSYQAVVGENPTEPLAENARQFDPQRTEKDAGDEDGD